MNWSGLFGALSSPHRMLPSLVVDSIASLNWKRVRAAGYTGVVLDKDNCLTRPLQDHLVPELQGSFASLLEVFGRRNVLIVSNSAGTSDDPALIQAEAVARALGVSVLIHKSKKPSRKCAALARQFFSDRPPAHFAPPDLNLQDASKKVRLLVIGDRLTTDVLLAKRMPASSILTTRLWASERPGTRIMRALEGSVYRLAARLSAHKEDVELRACVELPGTKPSRKVLETMQLSDGFRQPAALAKLGEMQRALEAKS